MFKVGDYVSRNSYNNDVIFKIEKIENNTAYLIGSNIRLCADSSLSDLKLIDTNEYNDKAFYEKIEEIRKFERSEYFYLPGKILHIDGDIYLNNNALTPYKIRENEKINNDKNNIKKKKIGNFS